MFKCAILKHALIYKHIYRIYIDVFSNGIAESDQTLTMKH